MSAFCDIWIGNTPAAQVRQSNDEWKLEPTQAGWWLSVPQGSKQHFFERFSKNGYDLLVLGQFYEPITQEDLLSRCVKYINDPAAGFNDPAGHYIIFLHDASQKSYHVFTNRFGTYHAYWLQENGLSAIGTSFLALAQHSKKKALDWEGITGFLGMGFFPNDKTYLDNIKIFTPASYYCFDNELQLLKQQRYWSWSHNVSGSGTDGRLQQLDERMSSSLSHAVKGHKVAIPISGGLDSRMLAGIIANNNDKTYQSLWGYSYGYTDKSVETRIAEKIAGSLYIPFHSYKVPDYLFDRLDLITESTDLFQYVDGTRQACMKEELEKHADVVIGGHWGDVWMDDMGIDASGNNETDALKAAFKKKIVKKGSDWLLKEVCNNYLPGSSNYLYTYFNDTIKKYDNISDPDFRFKAYKTDEWSFRWTLASIRMYQAAVFPILPFYDKYVADLFLQIPTDAVKKRELQIEYLKKYHPALAKITWQEYGRNLYSYKDFNNRHIVYRMYKKLARTIKNDKPITRNWEIFYLNPEGKHNLQKHLLDNKAFTDIVGAEKINQLLDDFYNEPSGGNGYAVSMLLTFSQAVKEIFN